MIPMLVQTLRNKFQDLIKLKCTIFCYMYDKLIHMYLCSWQTLQSLLIVITQLTCNITKYNSHLIITVEPKLAYTMKAHVPHLSIYCNMSPLWLLIRVGDISIFRSRIIKNHCHFCTFAKCKVYGNYTFTYTCWNSFYMTSKRELRNYQIWFFHLPSSKILFL